MNREPFMVQPIVGVAHMKAPLEAAANSGARTMPCPETIRDWHRRNDLERDGRSFIIFFEAGHHLVALPNFDGAGLAYRADEIHPWIRVSIHAAFTRGLIGGKSVVESGTFAACANSNSFG